MSKEYKIKKKFTGLIYHIKNSLEDQFGVGSVKVSESGRYTILRVEE